jgi:hypothetical protein
LQHIQVSNLLLSKSLNKSPNLNTTDYSQSQ